MKRSKVVFMTRLWMLSGFSLYVRFGFCGILLSVIMTPFLFFFRTVFSWLRAKVFLPVGHWVETHRKGIAFIAVFSFLAIFYNLSSTVACSGTFSGGSGIAGVTCSLVSLVVWFLSAVVEMLGRLMILLVDIFMHFAQYNSFGTAQPVQIGWPIVRDVCNMFFIVILLVSAFATIIGYPKDYDYRQVLPKLLLMAVLINFSKTLVLLLVDLSQVVMLSFVNAFSQAGPGNFAQIFQFNKMLEIAQTDNGTTATVTGNNAAAAQAANALGNNTGTTASDLGNYVNIIASVILALVLMCVACGVMIIMIMYVIARIVGLWIALIFSPLAFFTSALPKSLSSSLGPVASKYGSRLSGLLTGGPVLAFFLWLTFAVVQGANGDLAGGTSLVIASQGANQQSFLSTIGNTQSLATFIVGVAMMMMALEQAASVANETGGIVKKYGNMVADRTKAVAATTARFATGAAVGIGTAGVAPALLAGGSRLERKYDVRGRLAKGVRAVKPVGYVADSLLQGYSDALSGGKGKGTSLQAIQTSNTKREKQEQEDKMKFYNSLPDSDKDLERNWMNRTLWESANLATKGEMGAVGEQNQAYASADARKLRVKRQMDALTAGKNYTKDQRAQLEAKVKQDVDKEALQALDVSKSAFNKGGMMDKSIKAGEDMDKMYEQDPTLIKSAGILKGDDITAKEKDIMKKLQKDKAAAEASTVGTDARMAMKMLPDEAWIKNTSGNIVGIDPQYKDKFLETHKGSKAADAVNAIEKQVVGTNGGISRDQIEKMSIGKDSKGNTRLYDATTLPAGISTDKATDDKRFMKTTGEQAVEADFAAAFPTVGAGRDATQVDDMTASASMAAYNHAMEFGVKNTLNDKNVANAQDFAPAKAIGNRFNEALNNARFKASSANPTGPDDSDLKAVFAGWEGLSAGLEDVDSVSRAMVVSQIKVDSFGEFIKDPRAFEKLDGNQKKAITNHLNNLREARAQLTEKQVQGTLDARAQAILKDVSAELDKARQVVEVYEANRQKNDPRYPPALRSAMLGKDK